MKLSRWLLILFVALLASGGYLWNSAITHASSANPVIDAWTMAKQRGSYNFSSDVVQTTTPLATLKNVGRSSRTDAIYAVLAQMLGGLIAAFFAALLLNCDSASDISTWHQSAACTVLAEFFGAFAWVYALAHLTRFRLESSWQSAALGIGLTGTAMMYALGRLSGGAFNPAMALGFCVLSMIEWADYWMYLLGSLLGAAASATVVIGQLGREE